MTQTSRLTVVKKRDTNKRKLGGTINVIRNEDKGNHATILQYVLQ